MLSMVINFYPLWLYATAEVPLSSASSIIIRPSYWDSSDPIIGTGGGGTSGKMVRIGSDFGIRYYPNEKSNGFYLQGQIGLFHISSTKKNSNTAGLDFMGYAGWLWKIDNRVRIFFDAGMGLGESGLGGNSFIPDINFGIGFKLGKEKHKNK
jgi:hypothetical protein